jgi:glutamyl/glutaminyl-tRNA synthetase
MINDFCENIGVARKGNENYTSVKKLEFFARKELDANATRVFAVLEPLALNITNFA